MRPTRTTPAPPGLEVTPYAVQNTFRRAGSPRRSTANHSNSPGLSTQGEELFAPDRLACSATPRQRPLGSHLAMPPSRPGLATANRKTTRDASDRLLQSTFQRRAPVLRVKTGSLAGLASRAHPWAWRFTRSTRFGLPSRARVRRFLPDPDPRDDWTSDAPVTVRRPTTPWRCLPSDDRVRLPHRSVKSGGFERPRAPSLVKEPFPGSLPGPRCLHPDLAVDAPSPRWVSPPGLGPVHLPQPQPQMALLDPTPLDDFCFQHERHGHADERLLLA
jgi:hypothetical protein